MKLVPKISVPITYSKPFFLLILFFVTLSLLCVKTISDSNNSLVFKTCSDRKILTSRHQSHSQAFSSLLQELVSQSSKSKFFKTTQLSDLDDQTAISGLFQCREDISNETCRNCVETLPEMATNLCKTASSARVQLKECYIRYEPEDMLLEKYYSHNELVLLHKTCGAESNHVDGFEEMRSAAFSALEDAVVEEGGFCKTNYQLVQAMAQCEGEMEACECGECVNKAAEIAQEECGNAVSAEIYLDTCFLSYSYYPQGIPVDRENRGKSNSNNGRTLAIVLGGAAALCFGFIFMLFIKSWTKKDDDDLV
ncbi:Gnk2-like domain containing protein [Trema orientale]|uniref:Gnk2-like domain containing protein n=1 Tax=Trema orientale TaxID=63057 RepID=A0A2P5FYP9_TREOI|nr:Gnk2-like domain containing protein [Trema orientale]